MSDINKKLMKAFESINEQMEAHLIESIISLFNQGVLKHYIREPRQTIDESNFKMSIQAASGVTFEGREKLVELEGKIQSLESELEQLKKELSLAKKVRSHLDQVCDGTHEEVSCLTQIENEKLKKENKELREYKFRHEGFCQFKITKWIF